MYNQIEACPLLIELGAHVTPKASAKASCMDMIELLHPHLSQLEISTSGVFEPGFVRDLLESEIVDVNDLDLRGESALLAACTHPRSTETLKVLLEFGADIHVRGSRVVPGLIFRGETPCKFNLVKICLFYDSAHDFSS